MTTAAELPRLTTLSHGAGCACKLPLATLEQLMASVGQGLGGAGGDLLVGAADGDDAAVLRLDDERALVLTTDFFTPIVDDARDWGRIAAANALSDVYAMGGRPLYALVTVVVPPGRGADLEALCREAALVCMRRTINLRDFEKRIASHQLSALSVTTYDFRTAVKRIGPSIRR